MEDNEFVSGGKFYISDEEEIQIIKILPKSQMGMDYLMLK
jgi:hypothetical protein